MNKEFLKKLVLEELGNMEKEEECLEEGGCGQDHSMTPPMQDDDQEGRMHRSSLFKMAKYSVELLDMIQDEDDLPEWVESKITKAADYLGVVKHYLEADDAREMGALEESAFHRAKEEAIYNLAQQAVINIVKTKEFGSLVQKQNRQMFIEDSIDAISRLLKSFSESDDAREMGALEEEQISEDMIEDVFTEVDQNFKIYEAVQDAITEDGEMACPQCLYEILSDASCGCPDLVPEAEYQGRKVTLNKPTRGDVKKFKVYVKDPKTGNIKKVNFGHGGSSAKSKGEKTMKIRKSNPKARKNFRARHNCKTPGPKTKARYWSCRKW